MIIHHKKKKTKVHRFYVPEFFQPTISILKEILEREGRSLSEWIRENAEHYVRLHEPGNPQTRIDVIMETGKAYHADGPICGVKDCFRTAVGSGIFLPQNKNYDLCLIHFQEFQMDSRNWRINKGR